MGVLSAEHTDHVADMASAKPRERQFQVVPVPGTFTRGRWKCWDYKDKPSNVGDVLDFKVDKGAQLPSTVPVTTETQPELVANANAQPSATGDALTHTVSEPQLQTPAMGVVQTPPVSSSSATPSVDVPTNGLKESRTIVVTSIAPPPPVTPVRETPSVDAQPIHDPNVKLASTNTSTPSATLSRQTSLASFTDSGVPVVAAAPAVSTLPPIDGSLEDPTATGSAPSGPNVAIDNKIEQAMDLVKTHLTFAVREEVEILRSTIVDLESKVAHLESQNQVLKQFAPAEVVANLALLVQNAQQQKQLQQQIQQIPAAPVSAAQPVIVNTQPTHPVVVQQQPIAATSPPPTPVVLQPQQAQAVSQGVTLLPQQPLAPATSAPLLLPSAVAASHGDSLVSSTSFAAPVPQTFPAVIPGPQTFPATAPVAKTFPAATPETLGPSSSITGGVNGSSAAP